MQVRKIASKIGEAFGNVTANPVVRTVAGAAAVGLVLTQPAHASTVLTTDMITALETGFTNLKDTVADAIAVSWPYMLGVLALYAAPTVVKKLWNMAARG